MDDKTLKIMLESLIAHNQEMVDWCESREHEHSLQYYTGRVDAYEVVLEAINGANNER